MSLSLATSDPNDDSEAGAPALRLPVPPASVAIEQTFYGTKAPAVHSVNTARGGGVRWYEFRVDRQRNVCRRLSQEGRDELLDANWRFRLPGCGDGGAR